MSKLPIEFLRHIIDEIDYLNSEITLLGENRFMHDHTLQRAASRSLEIIGEAVKSMPGDFRRKYSDMDWKSFAGLRDKLIHHYFGVDYSIVWDILANELPEFKLKIESVISRENSIQK